MHEGVVNKSIVYCIRPHKLTAQVPPFPTPCRWVLRTIFPTCSLSNGFKVVHRGAMLTIDEGLYPPFHQAASWGRLHRTTAHAWYYYKCTIENSPLTHLNGSFCRNGVVFKDLTISEHHQLFFVAFRWDILNTISYSLYVFELLELKESVFTFNRSLLVVIPVVRIGQQACPQRKRCGGSMS